MFKNKSALNLPDIKQKSLQFLKRFFI